MQTNRQNIGRILIASAIALAVPLAAIARPPADAPRNCEGPARMHGHGERGATSGEHGARFLRGLDLTETQRDQIFGLMHAQAPAMREKRKEVLSTRAELRTLAMSAEFDEARVKTLTEANAKATAEMAQMRLRAEHQIYQLLTPEQRTQFEQRKARFEARTRERAEHPDRQRG